MSLALDARGATAPGAAWWLGGAFGALALAAAAQESVTAFGDRYQSQFQSAIYDSGEDWRPVSPAEDRFRLQSAPEPRRSRGSARFGVPEDDDLARQVWRGSLHSP
ncbi:MAG: hypothetical protein AAF677_05345 [Pseudomonadota bacterium]